MSGWEAFEAVLEARSGPGGWPVWIRRAIRGPGSVGAVGLSVWPR